MSDTNKTIVEKINDAFSANDVEGFLANCAEDVSWTMVGDRAVKGKDAIRSFMAEMGSIEPPIFGVDRMIADDNSVVCYGGMTMKDDKGQNSNWNYCDIYHFADGKVERMSSFVIKEKGEDGSTSSASA